MQPYGIIYKITNKINGKAYIGQTRRPLEARWRQHLSRRSHCTALKAAIDKYGSANFAIEVLASAMDADGLHHTEIALIKSLATLAPDGYNLTTGGDSPVHSELTRQKMSESRKKNFLDLEYKERMKVSLSKPELLKQKSRSSKERWANPEYKIKMALAMKKVRENPEYHKKLSGARRKQWQDSEYRSRTIELAKKGCAKRDRTLLQKTSKPVEATNIITGETTKYKSMASTKQYGFSPQQVSDCCRGKRKIHKSHTWRYA